MADNGKNTIRETHTPPTAELAPLQTNTQEYLRLLIDRERQIETMQATIHALELELNNLRGRIDEKDSTISELRAALDAAGKDKNANAASGPNTSAPLPLSDGSSDDSEPQSYPAPRTRSSHNRNVRIDDDVVARLKNDRKAYPIVCDKALHYWQLLANAELIDKRLKPTSRCGVTVMARIVSRMQTEVDPAISWAFFERFWDCDHLQSNLHRETYKHKKYYLVVNRIFGLADDAPFLTKSVLEA